MVPQENLLQYSLWQISKLLLVKPDGSSKYNKWTIYRITLLWSHGLSSLEKSEIRFSKTRSNKMFNSTLCLQLHLHLHCISWESAHGKEERGLPPPSKSKHQVFVVPPAEESGGGLSIHWILTDRWPFCRTSQKSWKEEVIIFLRSMYEN